MLIEECDEARCWVPVPPRSYTALYLYNLSLYRLPSTPSNEISELCTTQEQFSSHRIICAWPNPTAIKGSSKSLNGLSMSTCSLIIYSISPSYHPVTGSNLLGMALITLPIGTLTRAMKVKWADAKRNWTHQIFVVQVQGGQRGEFSHTVWNLSAQRPGPGLSAPRVKLCPAITQRPLQTVMTCLK